MKHKVVQWGICNAPQIINVPGGVSAGEAEEYFIISVIYLTSVIGHQTSATH